MIWLGEGVLKSKDPKASKKYISQYEEIPKNFIKDERLDQLKKLGLVGSDLPKEVKGEKIKAEAEKKSGKA